MFKGVHAWAADVVRRLAFATGHLSTEWKNFILYGIIKIDPNKFSIEFSVVNAPFCRIRHYCTTIPGSLHQGSGVTAPWLV